MRLARGISRGVDFAIGLFSPRRAARRAHFRRMAENPEYAELFFAVMRARGYRDAASGGTTTPWRGSAGSADAEILNDLPTFRQRSREINRDDPLGSGLIDTFVRNVIGTGLRPQARTGDPQVNEQVEEVFNERKDQLNLIDDLTYAEAQSLWLRRVLEDGDTLIASAKSTGAEPVWFETVEGERLATPLGKRARDAGGEIREGVEKNAYGKPVAYWVHEGHPGDTTLAAAGKWKDFKRLEAGRCRHLKFTERPGQSRGVPIFHAILLDLSDLDLLLGASLKRVQISACLAAFIRSPQREDLVFNLTADKYGMKLDQKIEPGMLYRLFPEEDVSTLTPNFPTPELGPFIIMLARRIGAAVGVSWQIVLKDFSDSTYSSARSDLLEARQVYLFLRHWLITKLLNWQWYVVLADARLRGDRRLSNVSDAQLRAVEWFGDGWSWVDPLKEVQSVRVELHSGLTTLEEVWMRMGKDPDAMWEKLQRQREKLEEIGLPDLLTAKPAAMGKRMLVDPEPRAPSPEPRSRRATSAKRGNGEPVTSPGRR